MSYTKLANSILTSTIWMEDSETRIVWLTLMAMADKNGEVQASIPGLANVARVPVEICREAIAKFLSPDPDSRTKDDEGRRIEEIRGGWHLINHAEYRELASDEDRKRKAAERQQRCRERAKRNESVPECHVLSHQIPQADAVCLEADDFSPQGEKSVSVSKRFVKPTISQLDSYAIELAHPEFDAEAFIDHFDSNGWKVGGKAAMKDWKAAVRTWIKRNKEDKKSGVIKEKPKDKFPWMSIKDPEERRREHDRLFLEIKDT